jgi:hypothetical protein
MTIRCWPSRVPGGAEGFSLLSDRQALGDSPRMAFAEMRIDGGVGNLYSAAPSPTTGLRGRGELLYPWLGRDATVCCVRWGLPTPTHRLLSALLPTRRLLVAPSVVAVSFKDKENNLIRSSSAFLLTGLLLGFAGAALPQPETTANGSMTGIRVEGQLFEVNSSMCVVRPDWSGNLRGGGQPSFTREGKVVTVKMQPAPGRPGRRGGAASAPSPGPSLLRGGIGRRHRSRHR